MATAHTYSPRIDDYLMPQPIMRWEDGYRGDFGKAKVPLQDGVLIFGESKGECRIHVEGIIHKDTADEVIEEAHALWDALHPSNDKFDLYRYYDGVNDNYVYWPNCRLENVRFARTNKPLNVLPYVIDALCPGGQYVERRGTASPTYGTRYWYGELVITLPSNDGSDAVVIRDSDGTALFRIDSDGNVIVKGYVEPGGTPTWP